MSCVHTLRLSWCVYFYIHVVIASACPFSLNSVFTVSCSEHLKSRWLLKAFLLLIHSLPKLKESDIVRANVLGFLFSKLF